MIFVTYFIINLLKNIIGLEKTRNILFKIAKEKFFYTEEVFSPNSKRIIKRLVVFLPGKGCWWAKQKKGGCTMCGFKKKLESIKSENYSAWDIVSLFKIAMDLSIPNYEEIAIFNGGSFLNDEEILSSAQERIFQIAQKSSFVKTLYIESRPEFILKEKIKKAIYILKNKKLKVGIGFEAVSNRIRNININKGLSLRQYEKAVRIIHNEGGEVLTYVFLKPIYTTEREAINEAVKTIKYAFVKGSNEIALEAAFIQEGTVMADLFNKGLYKPPWLWSVIDIIKKTYHLGFVHIGEFNDEPAPISIPSNCSLCNKKVMLAIQNYRKNHSLQELKGLECKCKEKWEEEIFSKEKA